MEYVEILQAEVRSQCGKHYVSINYSSIWTAMAV